MGSSFGRGWSVALSSDRPAAGVIDAHHHFWRPERGDYFWMPPDDPILSRDYGPNDLAPALAAAGVAQTVLVQAAPTVAETEFLLDIADQTPFVGGVVGWIDFEDRGQAATLERLARRPKFLGVRPMIQDLPDDGWMLRDDIAASRHLYGLAELHPELEAVEFDTLSGPSRPLSASSPWA